jgi:hypothetical protein
MMEKHKEMSCKGVKAAKGMKDPHKKKKHSGKHSKEKMHEAHKHMEKHMR